MPIVTQVICDRCPKVKGENNGWWVVFPETRWPQGFSVYSFDLVRDGGLDGAGVKILCSVTCLCEEIRMRTEKAGLPAASGAAGATATPA